MLMNTPIFALLPSAYYQLDLMLSKTTRNTYQPTRDSFAVDRAMVALRGLGPLYMTRIYLATLF